MMFKSSRSVLFLLLPLTAVKPFRIPSVKRAYDYDLVVIGAGASGMFGAGTAASFGCRTLLIEKLVKNTTTSTVGSNNKAAFHVGGDCTNQACVPSKAVASVSRIVAAQKKIGPMTVKDSDEKINFQDNFLSLAREHSKRTVEKVRGRESVDRLSSSPNLDLAFTSKVEFISPHSISLSHETFIFNSTSLNENKHNNSEGAQSSYTKESKEVHLSAKQFIIATGANPVVPRSLAKAAEKSNVPLLTYKTLYRPDGSGILSDECLWNIQSSSNTNNNRNIAIVGGGPVGVEIAQSLARLVPENSTVTIIGPSILASEDVSARFAAREMLKQDNVHIILGRRVVDVSRIKGKNAHIHLDDNTTVPLDVMILAIGRSPGSSLEELNLEKAGVKWTNDNGIQVNSNLLSSAKNIYAAGDCASAVDRRDRRAAHAGWTGYHAVQSALLPRLLLPQDSVHDFVPRVTFVHPEIASIGMTRAECVLKYGDGGFLYVKADERGTDRADTDSLERSPLGFVELRSHPTGRILGATVCSPNAAELINEVGFALVHRMSSRDIAKCLHAYPSHGYLLYRVALSLALSDVWGLLSACGTLGKFGGFLGRSLSFGIKRIRRASNRRRKWETRGAEFELIDYAGISFLDASKDSSIIEKARKLQRDGPKTNDTMIQFLQWLDEEPSAN